MGILGIIFIIIGTIGLLGMTVLFPAVAALLHSRRPHRVSPTDSISQTIKISITIPVKNDAERLRASLESIHVAQREIQSMSSRLQIVTHIGLDGCSDNSRDIAQAYGAEIHTNDISLGKWRTLESILSNMPLNDWVILCDAGALWPVNFFTSILSYVDDDEVIGVVPTYDNPSAGIAESLHWKLERALKPIENISGGPVSIHGATIAYRRKALGQALNALKPHAWLNDDVVIPLTLRSLFPNKRIVYLPQLKIYDAPETMLENPASLQTTPTTTSGDGFRRRRRLAIGNLQWLQYLLPNVIASNPIVLITLMRRIFRIFWGYWALSLTAGMYIVVVILSQGKTSSLWSGALYIAPFLGLITVCILSPLRRIGEAALVSIVSPFYLFSALLAQHRGSKSDALTEKVMWR